MPGLVTRAPPRSTVPLLLALAAVLALALPTTASAGSLTKRDRGGVSKQLAKRLHLTKKERQALDIASVQVTGKDDFGVVVDVRFKGNVERRIGRGHLKRAAIALVLEPKSKRAKSAVIVTQGPGSNQRIRRSTRSNNAGAIRTGRSVKFFIQGGGFSGVKAAKVRALPRAPRAAKRALAAGDPDDGIEEMTDAEVQEITTEAIAADAIAAALIASRIDPDDFDCPELEDLGDDLEAAINTARDYDDALTEAEAALQAEIEQAEGMERAQLEEELRQVRATRALVFFAAAVLRGLLDEVDAILDEECGPPPALLQAIMVWQNFGPGEVFAQDAYFYYGQMGIGAQITAIRIVVPPDGSTSRQVTNYLCPTQLPNGVVETTTSSSDTLVCSGGTLGIDERFRVNLRTNPPPTAGMGGQLFGQQEGSFKGPFAITGP